MNNELTTKPKWEVKDANELDQRIPKNLMMSMNGKPFVLKAGLEWKANQLFGLGNWSLKTEIVEYDRKENYALVKAAVVFNEQVYENYGEASKENVSNTAMHKYMLHMAVTRAEARALRVATACGFTAVEELEESKNYSPEPGLHIGEEIKRVKVEVDPEDPTKLDKCVKCGKVVTQKVRSFSLHKYGVIYCMDDQKNAVAVPDEEVELISEIFNQPA